MSANNMQFQLAASRSHRNFSTARNYPASNGTTPHVDIYQTPAHTNQQGSTAGAFLTAGLQKARGIDPIRAPTSRNPRDLDAVAMRAIVDHRDQKLQAGYRAAEAEYHARIVERRAEEEKWAAEAPRHQLQRQQAKSLGKRQRRSASRSSEPRLRRVAWSLNLRDLLNESAGYPEGAGGRHGIQERGGRSRER